MKEEFFMKKTLVSALTTALVVGAASTTFAAANPFSDVPADHWAYDAVSQLAADGVIEGYGDTTFRGNQNITRYEMAQMIAKAMAKSDVSAADKALIDKLAAEFSDELNNLGVRVSNLERNADKVKWNGKIEYTYTSTRHDFNKSKDEDAFDNKKNKDNLLFRLEPSAEVNDHWHVNARLDAATQMNYDKATPNTNEDNVKLKRVWAQGDYDNFQVKLGKMELYTNETGLLFDDEFSGAQVKFGNKLKTTLFAGRLDISDQALYGEPFSNFIEDANGYSKDDVANIQGINLDYGNNKFFAGAGYYHLNTDAFRALNKDEFGATYNYGKTSDDDANIWSVTAGYQFDRSSKLWGAYAQNTEADNFDNSWQAQYNYKGAEAANKGTWGAYVAYRKLAGYTSIMPTTDGVGYNQKGWEVGTNYTLFKNVVATAKYFKGKDLAPVSGDRDASKLFGRVEFFF